MYRLSIKGCARALTSNVTVNAAGSVKVIRLISNLDRVDVLWRNVLSHGREKVNRVPGPWTREIARVGEGLYINTLGSEFRY